MLSCDSLLISVCVFGCVSFSNVQSSKPLFRGFPYLHFSLQLLEHTTLAIDLRLCQQSDLSLTSSQISRHSSDLNIVSTLTSGCRICYTSDIQSVTSNSTCIHCKPISRPCFSLATFAHWLTDCFTCVLLVQWMSYPYPTSSLHVSKRPFPISPLTSAFPM